MRSTNVRESALSKLLAFAFQPAFDNDHTAAEMVFWGDALTTVPPHELQRVMASEDAAIKYNAWFLFDWELEGGGTPAEVFLRNAESVTPAERDYITRVGQAPLRLYEVEDVHPGRGLILVDLWSGERAAVVERTASTQIVRWDLLAARVAADGRGGHMLEGGVYLYPFGERDAILRHLRRVYRRYARRSPAGGDMGFFRACGTLFHHFWLQLVAFPQPPQVSTPDGEPLMFCRVIFDAPQVAQVQALLSEQADIQAGPGGDFSWTAVSHEGVREVGRWYVEGHRLVFETTSQGRAARARAWLEALAGPLVTYRATGLETLEQALDAIRRSGAGQRPDWGDPGAVREVFDRHYREWLDRPNREFGDRTPRAAARLARLRARLTRRLKQLENDSARAALGGQPPYDFGWLWKELRLDRP